jgi:hypothetical protein
MDSLSFIASSVPSFDKPTHCRAVYMRSMHSSPLVGDHGRRPSGTTAAELRPVPAAAWLLPSRPGIARVASGHGTFSAAAAGVLNSFTGSGVFGARYTRTAHSMRLEPGLPAYDLTLSWMSFRVAAGPAGISRIYGGIYFDNGNSAG